MKTASAVSVLSAPRIVGLALCVAFTQFAHGQQATNTSASPDDTNQQLLRRIDQLEAKVKQLEEKQTAPAPAPPTAPEPTPEPAVEGPRVNAVNDRLKLNVFGDVGYEASDLKPSSNTWEKSFLPLKTITP